MLIEEVKASFLKPLSSSLASTQSEFRTSLNKTLVTDSKLEYYPAERICRKVRCDQSRIQDSQVVPLTIEMLNDLKAVFEVKQLIKAQFLAGLPSFKVDVCKLNFCNDPVDQL